MEVTFWLANLDESALMDGDVDVHVAYAGLNSADALALAGEASSRAVRRLPIVPGVDLAGTVIASRSPKWRAGDLVVATG